MYIKSFQKRNGLFKDELLSLTSLPLRITGFLRHPDLQALSGAAILLAETRQAIATLELFGEMPKYTYARVPNNKTEVQKFIDRLDWSRPWGAGSHFSHLLFFLKRSLFTNKEELINAAIEIVNNLRNHDGFWYRGYTDEAQKINGAMKIITGLKAADRLSFSDGEQMVDLCLNAINNRNACDNFNIVYVLKYAWEQSGKVYRTDDIQRFMRKRLQMCREYYYPQSGGFSFRKGKTNCIYYNSPVARAKYEPDIHGTVMFLWGISIIAIVLGLENKLGFREFTP
ncbi:MAG: hypothetical protein GF401_07645 [Chitinivibrionales bacterium]|nr:hypothetical protein [Chitinivibrionales bacterium]